MIKSTFQWSNGKSTFQWFKKKELDEFVIKFEFETLSENWTFRWNLMKLTFCCCSIKGEQSFDYGIM